MVAVGIIGQDLKPGGSQRGDPLVRCKHCSHQFRGFSMREVSFARHEDGVRPCTEISEQQQQALSCVATEKADQLSAKKRKTELDVMTRSNSDPTLSSSIASNPVLLMYAKVDKASAEASVPRFFYANGLPFNASHA